MVTSQVPAANSAVPGGSTVILYLGDAAPEETTTVPNVVGMSYEGAKKALEAQGLFMQAAGSRHLLQRELQAQSQSVAAGESVADRHHRAGPVQHVGGGRSRRLL